ncbi:MAG TPA: zinc ribbon domain-containing protein [Candidatus Norongarragalinales archaeon]|nr:zinc ribbon domain-containing protein [Candidatus Norongarragalinales archaeon]
MGLLDSALKRVQSGLESKAESGIVTGASRTVNSAINQPKAPPSIQCPKCKKKIASPSIKFCPDDGTKLYLACQKCGKEYPLGSKFCTIDGQAL